MSRTKVILIVISTFLWVAAAFLKTQPKISSDNGELIIESAEDKNITFRLTDSSSFFVNDVDILDFAGSSKRRTTLISHTLGFSIMEDIKVIKRTMLAVQESLMQIEKRLRNETEEVLERIGESVNLIQGTVTVLEGKIRENNCANNPCANGGSCIDLFDDFYCQCLKSWQGKTCENDVDECLKFNGTNLGCQNNSTCVNFAGGYRCYCKPGWLGIHCTKRESDCINSPPGELCGHGTCIAANSPTGFTCICDQGWKSNTGTPACTVDVDECVEGKHNCKSGCVNLQGSFVCSPCSNGYTGNGVICTDINECEINNGGCSVAPKSECINSEGSYRCGSCPPDWTGDGKSCTRIQTHDCSMTNICHPLAECQVISNVYVCICPSGMSGSGYGLNGCTIIQTDPCEPNPCLNGGSCVRNSDNNTLFSCICVHGHGPKCEFGRPCATNPCKNGGTCVVQSESPGYRCDCPFGFEGVFCDRVFTLCGSIVRSPAGSGTIRFPRLGNYRAAERCAWLLRTSPDKVLVVNFTMFDLQDSEECRKDFLQINDGSSVASPLIGRFCGSLLPKGGSFTSTHHQLYFWFRSDDIIEAKGFYITWNSTKPICGGRIVVESHGTIQSPGYPGKSPSNRECEWELVGPPDKIIQLTFFEVEFPNRTDCYGDYLEVLDDFEERREILKLCETNLPPRLQTSSNVAIVHFHTDGSRSDSLFKAHYTLLEKPIQCGGVFSGPSGIFESPKITNNFEQVYLFCRYVIYSLPNSRIELNFESYQFESLPYHRVSGECKLFSLEIFDGDDEESMLIGRWCTQNKPEGIISSSNKMLIKYKVSVAYLSHDIGFIAKFREGCGGTFINSTGSFTSPRYPQNYLSDRTCTYKIQAPVGQVISLNMEDFRLRFNHSCDGSSYSDNVAYYSPAQEERFKVAHYCKSPPGTFISKYNTLIIVFYSNLLEPKEKGFNASYSFLPIGCGGVLTDPVGKIRFEHELDLSYKFCEWVIFAPVGNFILLRFNSFMLEDLNKECLVQKLSIYTNNTDPARLTGSYCGQASPPSSTYISNIVTIILEHKALMSRLLIEADYEFIKESTACGGNYIGNAGQLKSPNWPSAYPNGLNCEWIINVELGQQIELNVKNFKIENGECFYDFLEIRNGGLRDSPLIGKFCGENMPKKIPSASNKLYITFETDWSFSDEGFLIEWNAVSTKCGGILNAYKGTIISPHYPNLASQVAQCDWSIIISEGSVIDITVTILPEYLDYCNTEFLKIYDGSSTADNQLKMNCSDIGGKIRTSTNKAFIRYETISGGSSGAFILSYHIWCQNTITNIIGTIESPNFPDPYPNDIDCEWSIKTQGSNRISIAFSHVDLEKTNGGCIYDMLTIKDKTNESYICEKPEKTIKSEGNNINVKFKTDSSRSVGGFRLEYRIEGCGGYLKEDFGYIQSPNSPFSVNVFCYWVIEADYGQVIQFTISDLHLEGNNSTNGFILSNDQKEDHIIFNVRQTTANYQEVVSSGRMLYVRFFTDDIRQRKYFKAHYDFLSSSCGGRMSSKEGDLYSPNFPRTQGTFYCEWTLSAPQHYTLDLSFKYFDLDCTNSYFQIYSGYAQNPNGLIADLCGDTIPTIPNNISENSYLLVFNATNTMRKNNGFILHHSRNCGREFIDQSQEFFDKKQSDDGCIWTIKATNKTTHITLHFTSLECSCEGLPIEECESQKGISIHEGDSVNAPLIKNICKDHPPSIVSNGQALTVVGKTGSFSAQFSLYENDCGHFIQSPSGKFTSPQYPNSYPVNIECEWTIQAEAGNYIVISFDAMDIWSSEFCNEDYLEIRQDDYRGKLFGIFCGSEIPRNLKIYKSVWIKFRSGGDNVADGFMLSWKYAHYNLLSGSGGEIKSPPIHSVKNDDVDYMWIIEVSDDTVISLVFTDYHEGLRIYDGFDFTAEEISLHPTRPNVLSSSSAVTLISENRILKEFSIEWKAVLRNSLITNATGNCPKGFLMLSANNTKNISSPGYPNKYDSNLDCEWVLKPLESIYHVVLHVYEATLESMPNCDADYLQVSIGEDLINWLPEEKLCSHRLEMKPFKTYHGRPYLKINFKTDFSVNEIGFTSLARTSCGNTLTDSEVIIKSDDIYLDPDEAISICVWNIKVNPGKRIKFDILDMNFPSVNDYSNCQVYLSIRDGVDKYSAFLGESSKYCSREPPKLPETTSNRAVVEFHFKDTTNFHWQLKYTEVSDECMYNIRLDSDTNSTVISTPKIINPYLQCVWIIMAPPAHSLVMIFDGKFDLAQSYPCTLEYIEVKDGLTELSPLIGNYCLRPNNIHSTGKGFHLRYSTNTPEPNTGFQATIKVAKCGGTYNYRQSEIRSTNYPALGGYPSGTVCDYRIKLFEHDGINLTLSDIDLPIHSNTNESDHLTIFSIEKADNNKEKLNKITTIYANNTLNNVMIYTHMALIQFSTYSPNNAYRGFRIKYETVYQICGGEIFAESGKLTIEKDNPGRFCSWTVTVPKGQRITLEVLNIEESLDAKGDFSIEIFNDDRRDSKIAFDHKNTKVVQSSDNRIYIHIDRQFDSKLKGFEARFTSDEPSFCPHDIVDNFGTILFADKNETFYCETKFSLNSSQTLVLTIKKLSIINVVNRNISPFAIHGEYFTEKLLFYESIDKKVVPISTKVGILVLLQKEFKVLSGFEIEYKKLECGGVVLLDGAVSISKPNITGINGSIDCAWQVRSEYSNKYDFVGKFHLNNDCESEYFVIHTGSFITFNEGKKICGNDSLEFIIDYYGAYLVYHTNANKLNSSFEINMRPTLNCGGQVTEHEYSLQYIDFQPTDYKNNLQCVWDIQVQSSKSIEISFSGRFFIEESKNCTKDYLEIRKKVFGEWISLPKICGRHIPDTMVLTASDIQIIFRSDDTITADGFSIYFKPACGGVYSVTTEKREINSTMSFRFYEANLTCNYTLISQNYDLINVNFISLNLATDVSCSTGRMKVYKQYDDEMVEFGKYCSNSIKTIQSRRRIELIFEDFVDIGEYRFNYYLDTCGGDIRNSTTIKTPKDESGVKYPSDMICIWNITAPQNHSITIEFKEFDMHSSMECMYDYVRIYEGNNTEPENEKAHFCGNLTGHYPTVKISNSKAIIFAQSDQSISGSGFLASIKFSKNCDQQIYLTNSSIRLDKFLMPGEIDCYFDISTQEGAYNIRVQFRSLQLSNCAHECGCDYLEVREGQKANSQLFEKFCNSSVPTATFLFHENVLLRLVSDGVGSNVGFSADLHLESSECGLSDINLWQTETAEIKSPNFGVGLYPPNTFCKWNIRSNTTVELKIEKFDLEDNNMCPDYLKILWQNGEQDFQEPQKYCGNRIPHVIPIGVHSTEIQIIFKSNGQIQRNGFKMEVSRHFGCNKTYTGLSGRLQKGLVQGCVIVIEVPENYVLAFHFGSLIFPSNNCSEYFIKFFNRYTEELITRVCATETHRKQVFINSNSVKVQAIGDNEFFVDVTYIAAISSLGCGGNVSFSEYASFSSPSYPDEGRNTLNCRWSLYTANNRRISLKFITFDMGAKVNCERDYLQFIEISANGFENVARTYCGEDRPYTYESQRNELAVVYKKSVHFDGSGWILDALSII